MARRSTCTTGLAAHAAQARPVVLRCSSRHARRHHRPTVSASATAWALYQVTPEEADPLARLVLLVLADHAHKDGSSAFPSVATIAGSVGLSDRTVQRKLAALLDAGLIRLGDQGLVSHLRADRRPTVYDLALAARRQAVTPSSQDGVTETGSRGDTKGLERGDTAVSPEPKEEPKNARRRARDVGTCPRCGSRVQLDGDGEPMTHRDRDRRHCHPPAPVRTTEGDQARAAARAAVGRRAEPSPPAGQAEQPPQPVNGSPPSSQPETLSAGAAVDLSTPLTNGMSATSSTEQLAATTTRPTWRPSTAPATDAPARLSAALAGALSPYGVGPGDHRP